jgi:hypothetical protein
MLRHDIDDQRRPAGERVAAEASAGGVVIVLPEEAGVAVLAQHRAQQVEAQGGVQLLGPRLVGAGLRGVVMQRADCQVVDRYPNWPPAVHELHGEKQCMKVSGAARTKETPNHNKTMIQN